MGRAEGKRSKVVDHAICSAFHKCPVLIWANSLYDVGFGDIEDDTCGKFEKHFEEGDGTYTGPRLFAEGLDLPDKPEISNVLRDIALGPGKYPQSGSLHTVGSFYREAMCVLRALVHPG